MHRVLNIALLLIVLWPTLAIAQYTIKATGEFSMRIEDDMSLNEARRLAVQYAQLNAIENEFGKVLIQDNATYMQSRGSGNKTEATTSFNFVSNSYVKGEWVEDITQPVFKELQQGNERWLSVTVKGKIREVSTASSGYEAFTLSCPNTKCKTQSFYDGQDLYCYFKSPEDGYLSIYLCDPEFKYTFLMLPYNGSLLKNAVPIKADKDYVFFNRSADYFNDGMAIDEQIISLPACRISQKYQLLFLFSTAPLIKPTMEDETTTTRKLLDAASIKQGYSLQKGMPDEKFSTWLDAYRVRNRKLQVSQLSIDVNKMK